MKKHLIYFKELTIRKQYLYLTVISFVIMLILAVRILVQTRLAILNNSTEYANLFCSSLTSEISSITEQTYSICDQIRYDACSLSFLQADQWSDITAEMVKELTRQKSTIQETNYYIADLAYVSEMATWSTLYTKEHLLELVQLANDTPKNSCIGIQYSDFIQKSSSPYLVFKGPIYIESQLQGYILVSIHLSRLSLSALQNNDTDAYFMLTDSFGTTYAFNCETSLAEEISQFISSDEIYNNIPTTNTLRADNYVINYQTIAESNCTIISAINTRHITPQLKEISILVYFIVGIILLLLTLVYFIIYYNYVLPIRTFNNVILEIQNKRIRTLKEPLKLPGCKEMQQIGNSFSSMLDSINDLNRKIVFTSNKLYEMELQKKIAELSYLRSQINPHFIYNTLELMQDIASEYHVPDIGKIAVSMGKILRYSIKGDSFVPFSQEVQITMAYLNIQQARFHNRISIISNFQSETLDIPVIKMILQPLIENAVFHGLEPKLEDGILVLNSMIEQNILKITIRDNGVGIPEEKLKEIKNALNNSVIDTSKHIGLVNTNARIKLQYGEQYGLQIDSTPSDGTCISLYIPITKER